MNPSRQSLRAKSSLQPTVVAGKKRSQSYNHKEMIPPPSFISEPGKEPWAQMKTTVPTQTFISAHLDLQQGFLGVPVVKNTPANEGDVGSILESGRSPGEGNGNPFQYSYLENLVDKGA